VRGVVDLALHAVVGLCVRCATHLQSCREVDNTMIAHASQQFFVWKVTKPTPLHQNQVLEEREDFEGSEKDYHIFFFF
jgi:hypothetical protein